MERIIAVNSNCYHRYTIEDAIAGIKAAGFRYIELTATKGWTEHVFPDQTFEKLLAVKEMLLDAGITPFAMSGHCNLTDKARIGDFIKNMKLAEFFGCEYIVSSIGEAHIKNYSEGDNDEVIESVKALVLKLEECGLKLVLETHGYAHATGAAIADIVRGVGSDRVMINYDTANVIFYGGVDPCEDLARCISDVGYIHLKEKAGEKNEWSFPALGEGYVDFPRIFDMLDKCNNACPFSIEIEFTQNGPKDLSEVNDAVRKSADYLRAHGFTL